MFKLVVFLALVIAAAARPHVYLRPTRSPHHHHHHHGGIGFGGSVAHAQSFSNGYGGGYPGGYDSYPPVHSGYPVGGGYGGYPGGYGEYPGYGYGGGSSANAEASSFGLGFDWRR